MAFHLQLSVVPRNGPPNGALPSVATRGGSPEYGWRGSVRSTQAALDPRCVSRWPDCTEGRPHGVGDGGEIGRPREAEEEDEEEEEKGRRRKGGGKASWGIPRGSIQQEGCR